jgi:Amidohydrolase family
VKAGQLKKEFPDVYVQTHLSENLKEIDTVNELFPLSKGYHGYLDVYDHFGLLGPKSVFAHCVHLTDFGIQKTMPCMKEQSFIKMVRPRPTQPKLLAGMFGKERPLDG